MISMDQAFAGLALPRIDCIKIDIEGHEFEALQGMRKLIGHYHPMLMIEILSLNLERFGHSPSQIYAWLRDQAYQAFILGKSGELEAVAGSDMEDELVIFLHHADRRRYARISHG